MTDQHPPKLADEIVVDVAAGHYSLQIDGAEFPWAVGADGIRVEVSDDLVPGVHVFIPAVRVRLAHDFTRKERTA